MARGVVPDHAEPAATSLHGLRDLVKRLARLVERLYAGGRAGPLYVLYSRYESVSEQVPTEERLLPLDPARIPQPSPPGPRGFYRYLSVPALLAGLVSEYAFIGLYRAAAESFASEQASRLLAMDGATRNTERMLEGLWDLERRERQGQITRQVLEMIGARFTVQ
jgi:F-type H+-transporting ATPase subunit gamma